MPPPKRSPTIAPGWRDLSTSASDCEVVKLHFAASEQRTHFGSIFSGSGTIGVGVRVRRHILPAAAERLVELHEVGVLRQ
jgi:hypothetical protein